MSGEKSLKHSDAMKRWQIKRRRGKIREDNGAGGKLKKTPWRHTFESKLIRTRKLRKVMLKKKVNKNLCSRQADQDIC